jgi:hypothetical protein
VFMVTQRCDGRYIRLEESHRQPVKGSRVTPEATILCP